METIFAEEAVSEMAVRKGVAIDRENGMRIGPPCRGTEEMARMLKREESTRSHASLRFPAQRRC